MRRVEAFALGLLLLPVAAGAHGLHVLRGTLVRSEGRLRIVLESAAEHGESGTCLRLLDELEVLDASGARLVGTEREDTDGARCVLDYAAAGSGPLSLRLKASHRGPTRNERLVLGVEGARGRRPQALVLSSGSEAAILPARPQDD